MGVEQEGSIAFRLRHNDPDWAAVRPPMTALTDAQSKALLADLAKIGFTLGERRREAAE